MVMNDTCPSLQLSNNNSNQMHSNFHSRSLYINLPSPNPTDNSLTSGHANTNEAVVGVNTSANQVVSSNNIANSEARQGGSNHDNQSRSNSLFRRQNSYQQAQGVQIASSTLVSNSVNESNLNGNPTSTAVNNVSRVLGNNV